MPKVYSEFNPPPDGGITFDPEIEPSRTKQSFRDECDINLVMKRANGVDLSKATTPPQFGDFASAPDFMEAQNVIVRAREHFESLPSAVRERFGNDPAKLLAFIGDKNNKDEVIRLGLATAPPKVEPKPPVKVEVVTPPVANPPPVK
jgi:phage internal scaffolding protein